ncbi:MAG: hypothetical protein Q4G52_12015 [Clostridia bacterium]|nr:hypothetical protein [Clostridia bacterium]
MAVISCALALLSGVIGAGFASGREITRFFAGHGAASGAAIVCALATLSALFLRLSAQLERAQSPSFSALCSARFGHALGRLTSVLFLLLMGTTGGAMLAACAELAALTVPVSHAYALGLALSLLLGAALACAGLGGLALPGAALLVLLPVLLVRLLRLPAGEACFLPAMSPDLPVRAAADGAIYGALNAAMLSGAMPMLLALPSRARRRAVWLFAALFGALLVLGCAVCRRHLPAVWNQPMPFVALGRALGSGGYLLLAACLYAAALSTLSAMLAGLIRLLPFGPGASAACACLLCTLLARAGFGPIVSSGYPVLGALCAGLMLLLCLPAGSWRQSVKR